VTFVAAPARADEPAASSLVERRDGVEIDWGAGTVTATGGAAADLRMPGADVARAGSARRAEAAARTRLERALATLPLGGGRKLDEAAVARGVAHARVAGTEYQSNGGAVVRVTARFGDWSPEANAWSSLAAVVIAVPAMRLGAAPLVRLGGGADAEEVPPGFVTYRVGAAPKDPAPLHAKVDHAGRLVVEGRARDRALAAKLARGAALIYVEKVTR
jgi:hypothetical protein